MMQARTFGVARATALLGLTGFVALILVSCGARFNSMSLAESNLSTEALLDIPGLRFQGSCSFNPGTGALVIALAANDSVIIGRTSTSDGQITLNGNTSLCGNANYTNVSNMNVLVTGGGTGSSEAVVLDFENGFFTPPVAATAVGIWYDTGGSQDLDVLGIRMPAGSLPADQNVTIGRTGVHLRGTAARDIAFQNNPNTLIVAMGGGNDRINTAGDATLSGCSINGITKIYGNHGNDIIYTSGGNFNDVYYGNDGNDTIVVNGNSITSRMTISAGNSFETVSFAPRASGVTLTLSGDNAGP